LLFLITVSGCDGCRRKDSTAENGQAILDRPLNFDSFTPLPDDQSKRVNFAKPGHWSEGDMQLTTNIEEARGTISARSVIANSPRTSRGIALPEKQTRRFATRFLLPAVEIPEQSITNSNIAARFKSVDFDFRSTNGKNDLAARDSLSTLEPFEYLFVVLVDHQNVQRSRSASYAFLEFMDWAQIPRPQADGTEFQSLYRIIFPGAEDRSGLPTQFASWTTTAIVVWDDCPAERVESAPLQAMLDWLHWGGTLIVNGPAASNRLPASVEQLLPLSERRSVELPRNQLEQLITAWNVDSTMADPQLLATRVLGERPSFLGIEGSPHPEAESVIDSQSLVWRRRVGRGQIVFTCFDFTEGWFKKWTSGGNFIHNALLGHPPRYFYESGEWTFTHPQIGGNQSPLLATGLRVFARDAGFQSERGATALLGNSLVQSLQALQSEQSESSQTWRPDPQHADWDVSGFQPSPGAGMGGWFDDAQVARAARRALQGASGIEIPELKFVLRTLLVYLAVLVPLNYIVFRLLRRLEWAWLAVPVIALVGAGAVIRQAQLDIGFARSQNEVSVLELYGGYPRSHLTRFVSLYNSLSSSYVFDLEGEDTLAAPMRRRSNEASPAVLELFTRGGVRLSNMLVPSNQTEMVRIEQMFPVGGALMLTEDGRLANQSNLALRDTIVLRRATRGGSLEVAVVGSVNPGSIVPLSFRPLQELPYGGTEEMDLDLIWRMAAQCTPIRTGEYRCLAACDRLPGLTVSPAAAQQAGQTFVIAHLKLGPLPPLAKDPQLIERRPARRPDLEGFEMFEGDEDQETDSEAS